MISHFLGFQHFPRDLANVNEWKIMFDRYYCINSAKHGENVLCLAPGNKHNLKPCINSPRSREFPD